MPIISQLPDSTSKVGAKQLGRVKLVRKMDRILRNHAAGTNPLHHHPDFNGKSYHYTDLAKDFGLTRATVERLDKGFKRAESKKEAIVKTCKTLRIDPKLVDSRW